jgi:hypothetical protein
MEGKLIDLGSFSIPKLGIEVRDNPKFVQHMFLLGLCKILGDDTAQAKTRKMEAIQESFSAWNAGYQTIAAMEKARKAIVETAKSGKPVKVQFTQLDIAAALRDLRGPDDSYAAMFSLWDDEQFQSVMETLDDIDAELSQPIKDAVSKLQTDALKEIEIKAEQERKEKAEKAMAAFAMMKKA